MSQRTSFDFSLYYLLNLPSSRPPIELAQKAIAGGVTAIQLRAKNATAAELFNVAQDLLPLLQRHSVALIVNDRVDVALAAGADGVHLGRDDLPLSAARKIAPTLCIGVSCYGDLTRAKTLATQGADYLAFGSFFASPTKPQAPQIPLSLLQEARPLGLPLVAIGGITPQNAPSLLAQGADGLAIISAIQSANDITQAARTFSQQIQAARKT